MEIYPLSEFYSKRVRIGEEVLLKCADLDFDREYKKMCENAENHRNKYFEQEEIILID